MSKEQKAVNIKILDKEYGVSCTPDEEQELLSSASMVDRKMREIRQSGTIVGMDRIAVMAALNMANELLAAQGHGEHLETDAAGRLQAMRERVESALQFGQQLEI